jgi:glycolate oxidase iron-sulfur subunit
VSPAAPVPASLADALAAEEEGLLTCVHCGFCLPACPTYTRLGDENDSPRGRLYLMRAVVEGRLDAGSDAFQEHIDRCLGCRACEPVCPSGVPYGSLLELARAEAARARRPPFVSRAFLRVFGSGDGTRAVMFLSHLLRATGLPALLSRFLPSLPGLERVRLGLGMLAATSGWRGLRRVEGDPGPATAAEGSPPETPEGEVGILRGCVQEGLFSRVNEATVRVLEANGLVVSGVGDQGCCGAIHAHGGDLETARALARRNVEAFERSGVEQIVVNAAGCGAIMKEYAHLLGDDPVWADRAARMVARVRDVSEVLAARGPRRGGVVRMKVAYDAPCHLLHAQGIDEPPRRVLEAVPGLEVVKLEGAEECCGGAGIHGIQHPELGGRIGRDKVDAVRRSGARAVATGNPGCIMQIGAGLRMEGVDVPVLHPIEILDESYRRIGMYGSNER